MKICMVGQGAFAKKHLDGLARIKGAEVVTISGGSPESTEAVAKKYGIPHWTTNLGEALLHEVLTGEWIGLIRLAIAEARRFPDLGSSVIKITRERGRETIAQIKRRWPRIGVLVLAQPGHKDIEAAVQAGADGYVLLDENCTELFNAVRRIALGRGYISAAALDRVATSHGNKNERAPGQSLQAKLLTNREREVIALIAKGYRTREMAQLLSLSHKTVEKHRANLMRKLGLRSAAAAAVYAITHGLSEGTDTRDGSRRD